MKAHLSELTYTGSLRLMASFILSRPLSLMAYLSSAMTGLWLGLLCACCIDLAQLIKEPSVFGYCCWNRLNQYAAIEALTEGRDLFEPMKKEYVKRRDYIIEQMSALGFEMTSDGAFFIFSAKIPAGYKSRFLCLLAGF